MPQILSAPSPKVAKQSKSFLDLDLNEFLPNFNTRACFVRHRLVDHPLLGLPRLLELARTLPPKYVRINSGAVPVNAKPAEIPGTGLSTDDSFRLIQETNTRIMLKHIELDADYRGLLHACLGELEALGHPATKNVQSRVGYVFISAPNQITPYHMDPEINFLLQIKGTKTFHVLPGDDRSILSEEDIERFYSGRHDHLPFKAEWKGRATPFEMHPGDGVHIPVNHPHWVTTENGVTISFALTTETAGTRRRGAIYAVNSQLRKRGLKPVAFGRCAVRDFLKYNGYRIWNGLGSLVRRSKPHDH